MLLSLSIRDFVIVDLLDLDFSSGFTVLTGETGAGKSIVVDSINLLLGERADRGLIRTGCDKATVEGVFDIADSPQVREAHGQHYSVVSGWLSSSQPEPVRPSAVVARTSVRGIRP